MKRKLSVLLLALVMLSGLFPQAAFAASPPAQIGAPMNFGVSEYGGNYVYCTLSAPDDLRALLMQPQAERGYSMVIYAQFDMKIDGGNWHYTPQWDSAADWRKHAINAGNTLIGGQNGQFLGHFERFNLETLFPEDKGILPPSNSANGWEWYKSHAITFRARFAVDFGGGSIVFSDWTPDYVLSSKSVMGYKSIMANNAPTLLSAKLEENANNKRPYVVIQAERHPDATQKFNAATGNNMWAEVWLRKSGDADFKLVGAVPFSNETLRLDVSAYYGNNVPDYAAAAYEVKVRYKVDERAYKQSGATAMNLLYSPYSNTLSYGMPAWSAASAWATAELKKADDAGLIPGILKGADLTKPITREEFCELALLLYEKTTGKTPAPASPNPFTDTKNAQVLKAFALGITKGTSDTTFSPKNLITRQECATMLYRAIKAIAPGADYSIAGVADFPDQKDIDSWAVEGTKYMSKLGIIKGDNRGYFMPRATTTAQTAAGYGMATREAAILMSVRTYDVLP